MAGSIRQRVRSNNAARVALRVVLTWILFPGAVDARDPHTSSDRQRHHLKKSSTYSRSAVQPMDGAHASGDLPNGDIASSSGVAVRSSASRLDRYQTDDVTITSTEQTSQLRASATSKDSDTAGIASTSDSSSRVVRRAFEPLVAETGPDQLVDGSSVVILDAGDSRGIGSRTISYHWVQTNGPPVVLTSPGGEQTEFMAPPPSNHPIYLTFGLTVKQGMLWAFDSVNVVVRPVSLTEPASDQKVLEWLQELDPLPKVHYSWPFGTAQFETMDERLLREYARITHSLCVSGEFVSKEMLFAAATLAGQVNDTNPDIPVTLCVVFRPWMRVFPLTEPPTYLGPEHDGEIDLFTTRLARVKDWLAEFNEGRSWDPIEISAVLLECERFFIKQEGEPGYEAWNSAITVKHNAIYDAAREVMPHARIEWYNRGISTLFTLEERGDTYSIPLYSAPLRAVMRTAFRRTVEAAVADGVAQVTPWVALGSAYIHMPDGARVWSFDYDYDLVYSWHIGAEINDPWYGDRPTQFAPWHAAKVVIFWPRPWDDRVADWARHFVAYVRGAHNITQLPR